MNDRLRKYIDNKKRNTFENLLRNQSVIERVRSYPLASLEARIRPISLTWNDKTYTITISYATTVVQWYPSKDKLSVREGNLIQRTIPIQASEVLRCLEIGPTAFRSLR